MDVREKAVIILGIHTFDAGLYAMLFPHPWWIEPSIAAAWIAMVLILGTEKREEAEQGG